MEDLIFLLRFLLLLGSPCLAFYKLYKFSRLSKKGVIYSLIASFFFSVFIMADVVYLLNLLGFLSSSEEDKTADNIMGLFFSSFFAFLIYASCGMKGKKHRKAENISEEECASPCNVYDENDDYIVIKYRDAVGNVSARKIKVLKVYSDRVDAYCCLREQERTFIIDRIIDDIIDIQTGEVINKWEWFDRIGGQKPLSVSSATKFGITSMANVESEELLESEKDSDIEHGLISDKSRLIGSEILFTGFTRDIRLCLEDAARASGMVVRTKVTKNLNYLVCGSNDAPTKRLEAINVGASIVYGEEGFRSLLVD